MFKESNFTWVFTLAILFSLAFLQPFIANGQDRTPKVGICTLQRVKPINITVSSKDFASAKELLASESKTALEASSVLPAPQPFQITYNKATNIQGNSGSNSNTIIITDQDAQTIASALHVLGKINMTKHRSAKAQQLFKLAIIMLKDSKRLYDLPLFESDYAESLGIKSKP